MQRDKIIVLDFGSQYAHLIAKRLRLMGYYSEIAMPDSKAADLAGAKGIILSGGPASVYGENVPDCNKEIFSLNIPILGLCYGHQLMAKHYGGSVKKAKVGEFGKANLTFTKSGKDSALFKGVTDGTQVWMSHQDEIVVPGSGFEVIGSTKDCACAALQNTTLKRYSLQYHCEVKDSTEGNTVFENFAKTICGMEKNWNEDAVLSHIIEEIKQKAGKKNVLLFLSGGVDSTVAFALLNKALGKDRVLGLHIDNGFMRKNESADVAASYRAHGFSNFITEDASATFLEAVAGLCDPQKKRMAVGETFIKVRDAVVQAQNLAEGEWLLAQGTLYPDIIESGGTKNSNVIKTHHNRVEGIQKLIQQGLIIEPLKDLYKDEVRAIGKKLGLSAELVNRHPFPGPGLSINVLCSQGIFSADDEAELKKAQIELDNVALDMFCPHCTQSLTRFVLPVRSVGVQGDFRTYRFPAVLSFGAEDGGFFHLPKKWEKLEEASVRVTNNAEYINRCVIRLWQNPAVQEESLSLQKGFCTAYRLDQTRDADNIVLTALKNEGWYNKVFQHLTINLPYASKAERCSIVLRPVFSEDVMTARFARLPQDMLMGIVKSIAQLGYVDAVFFDLSNKPPATFGWE